MRSLTVTLPGRPVWEREKGRKGFDHPPGVNETDRMIHWQRRKVREEWKGKTVSEARFAINRWEIGSSDPWEPLAHCHVAVLWRFRLRRNRDFDNLVSGLKPVLDGLVAAKVIEDDHTGCVMKLGPFRVEVGTEEDETVIEVRECGPDGLHRLSFPEVVIDG